MSPQHSYTLCSTNLALFWGSERGRVSSLESCELSLAAKVGLESGERG